MDADDTQLVAATRVGDDRAFELLYQRYHRRIAAYVQGMVHDHARAEDITQDVFMSALRRMRDTERSIAFKPWIYEIAKNACIDAFRRSRRAEEVSYDADEGLGASDYGRLVSTTAGPDSAVETKQRLDHLRGAFGGLSDAHHQILVMRELEGLSYREIGERLGLSRPSVESTLFRARRRLSEEYEELVSGERCRRIQDVIAAAGPRPLGARDQRRMARHISHCQPCRRQARLAGIDVAVTARRPVRAKIAAFLPLPAFLRDRWLGSDGGGVSGASLAQWSAHVAPYADTSVGGWVKAAAAAATVAVAGVGAGAATQRPPGVADAFDATPIVRAVGTGPSSSPEARRRAASATEPRAVRRSSAAGASRRAASGTGATRAEGTSGSTTTRRTAGSRRPGGQRAGGQGGSGSGSADPGAPGSGSGTTAGGDTTSSLTGAPGGSPEPVRRVVEETAAPGLALPESGGSTPAAPRPESGDGGTPTGTASPSLEDPSVTPRLDDAVGEIQGEEKAVDEATSGLQGALGSGG